MSMNVASQFSSSIKPLQSISPTAFIGANECALKMVWSSSGNPALLPTFPGVYGGRAVHRLLLEAGQGQLPPDKTMISTRWNEIVEDVHSEMRAVSVERHLVPLSDSDPHMAVRRIQAIQKAHEIAGTRQPQRRDGRVMEPTARYGREIPVRSSDGLIRGRIDAAIPHNGGVVVRDYKSGEITETSGKSDPQLKETYRIQLKMYAALYAESFGKWPDSLEVVPLSGAAQEVAFEKEDCSNLLAGAKLILRQLNNKIMSNAKTVLPSLLASPSPGACTYCQYRPACRVYQAATPGPGIDGWPPDVIGTLADVRQLGNSKMMLQVATSNGPVSIPGLSPGDRHPTLQAVQRNDVVGVFNIKRDRPTAPYSESQLTTVYKIGP